MINLCAKLELTELVRAIFMIITDNKIMHSTRHTLLSFHCNAKRAPACVWRDCSVIAAHNEIIRQVISNGNYIGHDSLHLCFRVCLPKLQIASFLPIDTLVSKPFTAFWLHVCILRCLQWPLRWRSQVLSYLSALHLFLHLPSILNETPQQQHWFIHYQGPCSNSTTRYIIIAAKFTDKNNGDELKTYLCSKRHHLNLVTKIQVLPNL